MSISEERESNAENVLEDFKTQVATAHILMQKGYSVAKIALEMKLSESSVRTLLNAPDEFKESK